MYKLAKISSLNFTFDDESRDNDACIIVNLECEDGRYFSEDCTDVIRSIFGYAISLRKLMRPVRKMIVSKLVRFEFKCEEGSDKIVIPDFNEKLRDAILAA